jgi:threonyl-tRNA synthetase
MISYASFQYLYWCMFVVVVGEKEHSGGTVNVRTRDNVVHGEFSVEAVIQKFQSLKDKRVLDSELDY